MLTPSKITYTAPAPGVVGELAAGTPITTAPPPVACTSQIATVASGAVLDGPITWPSGAAVARSTTVVSTVVVSASLASWIESSVSPPAGNVTPGALPDAIFAPVSSNASASALMVSAWLLPVSRRNESLPPNLNPLAASKVITRSSVLVYAIATLGSDSDGTSPTNPPGSAVTVRRSVRAVVSNPAMSRSTRMPFGELHAAVASGASNANASIEAR